MADVEKSVEGNITISDSLAAPEISEDILRDGAIGPIPEEATEAKTDQPASDQKEEVDDTFEVEEVVGMTKADGKTLYKVRWLGYGPEWDTWEPYENLESCVDMIDTYRKAHEDVKKKKPKKTTERKAEPVAKLLDEDVFSDEASDSTMEPGKGTTPGTAGSGSKQKAKGRGSYTIVDSDDENFNTLKDTFWDDVEHGRISFAGADMYSKVKATGRSSRPKSFKSMFSDRIPTAPDQTPTSSEKKKKKVKRQDSTDSNTKQKVKRKSSSSKKARTQSMELSESDSRSSHVSLLLPAARATISGGEAGQSTTDTEDYSADAETNPEIVISSESDMDDTPILDRLKQTEKTRPISEKEEVTVLNSQNTTKKKKVPTATLR